MMREGKARARAAGRRSEGRPPYGSRSERGELVPDAHEQAGIARAVALHAEGRSLREIGRTLDAEGFPPKQAARWSAASVSAILRRQEVQALPLPGEAVAPGASGAGEGGDGG